MKYYHLMDWPEAGGRGNYVGGVTDLNPTVGAQLRKVRPVVVVSRNEMNQFLDTVVVCPLTTVLH